ncbi:tyrosine-type recombinase/integrase [Streptomyces tateyamensis]|uniref:tyrosine-type recombinase/integrase n=1 Tax=Streptomyces tateyamensis TaxID=565073 RepID=UPI001FE49AE5|nr:tyrosine-type recombinase/integrase [Streptomyces tateyamensis]
MYAGRVALYLSWCAERGVDWSRAGLLDLGRFLRWLVAEPLPARSWKHATEPRYRKESTANAVITAVCEFLRFGSRHGWVPLEVAALLSEPKYLSHLPTGYNAGEDGQFRTVRARSLKFTTAQEGYEWLTDDQVDRLVAATGRARDRFLVALLACTGVRIGEALGLRREDMHLLSHSGTLGCPVAGPHIHVRRRRHNANGALAKSRVPRWIPVTEDVVSLYADYQFERVQIRQADDTDMVFVNLFRGPLGRPMTYASVKDLFDRLARSIGFPARPHMLRHSAATRWVRAGVDRDVIQTLMGHASSASMDQYLHATDQDLRDAVERVGAARGGSW